MTMITTHYQLPLLVTHQAQKEVTVNEAFVQIDTLLFELANQVGNTEPSPPPDPTPPPTEEPEPDPPIMLIEILPGFIEQPQDKLYPLILAMPFASQLTKLSFMVEEGACQLELLMNGTVQGEAFSPTQQLNTHVLSLPLASNDRLDLQISQVTGANNLSFQCEFERNL